MSDISDTNDQSQSKKGTKPKSKPDIMDALKPLIEVLRDGDDDEAKKSIACTAISKFLKDSVSTNPILNTYNLLIHYDFTTLLKNDADDIYSAVTSFQDKKHVLMLIHSYGGEIGAAYLIGQLCREYSNGKLVITVPRVAKSAATLLSCAADEIHMGSMSELGPIDPQINDMPVLGLKNSIEHISQLVSDHPKSSDMFAEYLSKTVKPIDIGYNERVAESAMQYAERLLSTHKNVLSDTPSNIAKSLVYTYKDHSFVIDKNEATAIFGDKVVKINSAEYNFSNEIYVSLKMFKEFASAFNYHFVYIGTLEKGAKLIKKQKR